jgi:lipopolysaccharide export system protein LptA
MLAVETTVKGGHMELLEKGEKVLFRDNVRMERGTDVVQANEMVTTKERDKLSARGNVRLFREVSSTETWRGRGAEGFYNTKTGEGYLVGRVEQANLIRTEVLTSTSSREINVLADRIDFERNVSQAVATGRVYTKTIDPETKNLYEFWSDRAVYDGANKMLTLSGDVQPRVKETASDGTKIITGNTITYQVERKVFVSDGDAVAVFLDDGEKK